MLSANSAFYSAFGQQSLADMEALWGGAGGDAATVACAHPGQALLLGREAVLESWEKIFDGPAMSITPEVECCRLLRGGQAAMVLCKERVGGVGAGALLATNIFEKDEDGTWRIVQHQAGPIAT